MHSSLQDLSKLIFDTLFPIYCLSCHTGSVNYFCNSCELQLTRLATQCCIVCRTPSVEGLTHPKCTTPSKPARLLSVFDYHDKDISQAIITGKYQFIPMIYEQLSTISASILKNEYPRIVEIDFITPIPLSTKRKRWRGFNQAEIFAECLSRAWNIEMAFFLQRIKNTGTQKDLDHTKRFRNMRNAFAAIDTKRFQGKRILLVDDVVTTGATFLEAAKILKRAGAGEVYCVTIAQD